MEPPANPGAARSPLDVTRLRGLLEGLEKALHDILEQASSGKVAPSETFERLRQQMLEALVQSPIAADVGTLQKYLRMAAVDVVSALGTPGITPSDVVELLARQQSEFERARQDLLDRLDGKTPAFWTSSI